LRLLEVVCGIGLEYPMMFASMPFKRIREPEKRPMHNEAMKQPFKE
jgi:hypothetical protein